MKTIIDLITHKLVMKTLAPTLGAEKSIAMLVHMSVLHKTKSDVAPVTDVATPRPTSPPSGPMTRARVKALHDEVNSLLTTLDLGTPLDGLLPHADVLCVIRYKEHQDHGEEDTPWSKGGEEQLDVKMDMELDRKSPEEHNEEKLAGRSRTRSDRPPDRVTRSKPDFPLVPSGRYPGAPEPRPVAARSRARSGPACPVPGPV
jgi:hypothetical protein